MAHDFADFNRTSESTLLWLKKEYAGIRTSEASPRILDGVSVEVYGSKMPINQIATVVSAGPKSLLITPWDNTVAPNIDRAIRESNLGLSVSLDSQGIRVAFPELTSERRLILTKTVREKLEEARIKVRTEREKSLSDIDRKVDEGIFSKDDKFRIRTELQKLVDDTNSKLEQSALKKEKEIQE